MGNRVKTSMVLVAMALVASLSPSAAAGAPAASLTNGIDETATAHRAVPRTAQFPEALSLGAAPTLAQAEQPSRSSGVPSPIVFQDGFESLSLWGGRSPSSRNKVELTPAGYDGAGLRVRIPRGSHFGADFKLDLSKTLGEDPDNLFFRYYLKFDPDWAPTSAGKLPGFSGVYGSSGLGGNPSRPSNPGWSSRMAFFPSRNGDPRATIGYYVYHLGQKKHYGDSMRWNQAGKLVPGNWYCLEGEIQLNSLGAADGRLRAWVDGTPAFHATGLEFRRPTEPNIRIESFWFNVYYGGKSVPSRDLGLTIDSVAVGDDRIGCGAGSGTSDSVDGDLDGDGLDDLLTWTSCRGGPCFRMKTTSVTSGSTATRLGHNAWFSLQTHRFGMASGDLDGDGRDELIYRGRCAGSETCWRVHQVKSGTLGRGRDWGGGALFAPNAAALVLGDWNGDGLDDLAYQGRCKAAADAVCWRVHRSTGEEFAQAKDWGPTSTETLLPIAADVTGDGLDDLLYTASCRRTICWYAQPSLGSGFGAPVSLGRAHDSEVAGNDIIDFDGDGADDLVSVNSNGETSRIEVRLMREGRLGAPHSVAVLDGTDVDIGLRRAGKNGPTEAIVRFDCRQQEPCLQHLAAWSMELVPVSEYRQLRIRNGEQTVE